MSELTRQGPAPEVLCVGETMVLVTPTESLPLVDTDLFRLTTAGAESTVALYLTELGHAVSWASRLGDDPLGERVIRELDRHGVDRSLVRRDPQAPTGVFFKDPAPGGTARYYYRAGSAASRMTAEDAGTFLSRPPKLVHLSGITPALSTSCAELVDALVTQSAALGALVSFDVNYRCPLWSVPRAAPALLELARRADVVFVGLDEARTLWNTTAAEDVRHLIGTHNRLVVKDGAIGAVEFHGDASCFEPAEQVLVVEPVGAGDAFAAGFLSGLLTGAGAAQRLRGGHTLAARTLGSTSDFVPVRFSPGEG